METQGARKPNYYSAFKHQGSVHEGLWTGWMQYEGKGQIIRTPDMYRTQREALAAIRAQHPDR